MKVELLYDVYCDICGRSMSYDFASGLCDSVEAAVKEAFRIGFSEKNGKRSCPVCLEIPERDSRSVVPFPIIDF